MEIPFPGDEVIRVWPPNVPPEEQARFIFRVPDYRTTKKLMRAIEKVAIDEIQPEDGWRIYVGLTLDRIEGLMHAGSEVTLDRDEEGSLTEESGARLGPLLRWLFGIAQSFIVLSEREAKNS